MRRIYSAASCHTSYGQRALTPAEKYARFYEYGVRDHFRDTGELQEAAQGRQRAQALALPQPAAPSAHSRQIVGFLKAHAQAGTVMSMPRLLFAQAEHTPGIQLEQQCSWQADTVRAAFLDHLPDLTAAECQDHVFFSVVDPRPEDKFQMQAAGQAVEGRTNLKVDLLPWTDWAVDGRSLSAVTRTARAEACTLDAAAFCTAENCFV